MNLRFLCANHRQWLVADLARAEQHWLERMETGSNFVEQGLIDEAIPFFGCAFEIAEILLTHAWPDIDNAVSCFTLSSICLAHTYEQLGERDTQEYLIVQANCRLAKELPKSNKYPHVAQCMQSLHWAELGRDLSDYCTNLGLSNPLASRVSLVH